MLKTNFRMKVLYIIDPGTIGGATHSFFEMIMQMRDKNVIPIVCISEYTEFCELLKSNSIQYIELRHQTVLYPLKINHLRDYFSLFKVAVKYYLCELYALYRANRLIDFSQIDIIHTNSARNDIGCYLSKIYKKPHIMHIREFSDLDFECKSLNPFYITLYRNGVNRFIAISKAVAYHWINKGLPKEKISVIYNGINYHKIERNRDFSSNLKIVMVGGVTKSKGQFVAIEALSLLPAEIRCQISLDIIGWGSESTFKECRSMIQKFGIGNQVNILGSRNDVYSMLSNYNVGLMCSRAEGFGRSTAEYMHAGLGVIASNSGANPELIENEVTGLLFESENSKDLAKCIERFFYDRDLLSKCANNAFIKARKNYTQELNADNIFTVYKEFI